LAIDLSLFLYRLFLSQLTVLKRVIDFAGQRTGTPAEGLGDALSFARFGVSTAVLHTSVQDEKFHSPELHESLQTVLRIECRICGEKREVGALDLSAYKNDLDCEQCGRATMHRLLEIEERRNQQIPFNFADMWKGVNRNGESRRSKTGIS